MYARDQHGSDRSYAAYPNGYATSPAAFWAGNTPAPLVAAPACGSVTVPTGQGFGGEYGGQYTAYNGNGPMNGNFGLYQHHAYAHANGAPGYFPEGHHGSGSTPYTYGELATIGYGSLVGRGENYGVNSHYGLGAYGHSNQYGGGHGRYPHDPAGADVRATQFYPRPPAQEPMGVNQQLLNVA